MTYFKIKESGLLIILLVSILVSSAVLFIWTYSKMVASVERVVRFERFERVTGSLSNFLYIKPGIAMPAPEEFARLKTLLQQGTDIKTGEIIDISAYIQFFDEFDQYLNNYWEQLPEESRNYVLCRTRMIPKAMPDEQGRFSPSAILLALWELRDRFFPNLGRFISLYKQVGRENFNLLISTNQALINTVQRLGEQEQQRKELRHKLAQYPDWDREEQIRRNQGAMEWAKQRTEQLENSKPTRKEVEEYFEIKKSISKD